ncbi:sensor histidine kinase DpiB [Clostridium homopropionicum DSM 5847]|uniref:Sensor histidine kinase DpiB n=1 Tax=Clostridium homopropionicum DSM 5847 TaxID=1121318 RepID=A0A0L6ZB44_9CLOT|nr:ATP-binding protein [Clostridium homopropionicum]KOA20189.1 sensor histidine kinase DpiB [Clostridium homopropionicum DSM 5847]SFG59831.1 Sensor_kinase_SpoOB-type, alpha-helical domain [Clostridium homopropionicum]
MSYNAIWGESLAGLFETITIVLIYLEIFDKTYYLKENKYKIISLIVMSTAFSAWASLIIEPGYHTMVIITFMTIILSIQISTKFLKSFIAVLIGVIFIGIIDFFVLIIFSFFLGHSLFDLDILNQYKGQVMFVAKFVELFIIFLIYKFNKKMIRLQSGDVDEGILGYWVLGMFLMTLFISIGIFNKADSFILQMSLYLFLFIFIIVGMLDYKKKMELLQIKNKFHLKEEYINNLEAIVDIIRREKHDFANHINTIYAMCIMNRPDSLDRIKNYLKNTTNNLESSYKFFETGNGYVDGLIAVKSNFAFENDIYLDVDFETSLEAVIINDNDLVRVIGNIIDNAFYAVNLKKDEGKKIVSVYGYIENDRYYLSIANNGPMVPKEIGNKIFKKGFSTKENNKKDHGFGLYIVDQIVKKNGGEILFSSSQEETEFLIEFRVKQEYYGKIS